MLKCTQAISSTKYLTQNGIHRPNSTFSGGAWKKLTQTVKSYNAAIKNGKEPKTEVEPGIYVRGTTECAHYYGIRKEKDGTLLAGNGYPKAGGFGSPHVGLDAQKDRSHGLCQTFALIFYLGKESILKRGEKHYFNNVVKALKFMEKQTNSGKLISDWYWDSFEELYESMDKIACDCDEEEKKKLLRKIIFDQRKKEGYDEVIYLSTLFSILISPKNRSYLKTWFGIDPTLCS